MRTRRKIVKKTALYRRIENCDRICLSHRLSSSGGSSWHFLFKAIPLDVVHGQRNYGNSDKDMFSVEILLKGT